MRLCPYCKQEATGVGGGDEFLDFCVECDMIIEGETIDEVEYLRSACKKAHDELMNLQPHIPSCCYPGMEGFIDDHVDKAMEILVEVDDELSNQAD